MDLIIDKITTIFRTVFNDESIILNNGTTANDVGSWDSLTHMVMIAEVEEAFSIKFKLREINKLKDVGSLVELIHSKISG